jgi:mannitol-specific phosphotransferase system IIBC component
LKTLKCEKVQRFGGFLAAMIIPNLAAFIAWGLITAMFIPVGWLPNETFAKLVEPLIKYLLPLLIGYTGGKMIYDTRGGVVAQPRWGCSGASAYVYRRDGDGTARWFLNQEN